MNGVSLSLLSYLESPLISCDFQNVKSAQRCKYDGDQSEMSNQLLLAMVDTLNLYDLMNVVSQST